MSFSNPILAGEELVRSAIRSDNYVAGVSGWRIARDGNAEFNNVVIRGDLNVIGDSPNEYLRIYQALGVPTTEWSTGNAVWESYAADWNIGPPLVSFLKITSSGSGGIFIMSTGEVCFTRGNLADPGVAHDPTVGFLKATSGFLPTKFEEWTNLSLASSWVTDVETPQYKLMPDGTVAFRGNMKDGTTANGTTIANIPAGYRPPTNQRFITAEKQTGLAWRHVAIDTAGVMRVWNATTAHICLDGVRYPVV